MRTLENPMLTTSRNAFGHVTPFSPHRTGFGVLDPHSAMFPEDETGRYVAWLYFLDAIRVRHPQVLASLARLSRGLACASTGPTRAVILQWLHRWHLGHDIAYLATAGTLKHWQAQPHRRRVHRWIRPRLAVWRMPESAYQPIMPDPATPAAAIRSRATARAAAGRPRLLRARHS